jgi:hypothetical protein
MEIFKWYNLKCVMFKFVIEARGKIGKYSKNLGKSTIYVGSTYQSLRKLTKEL